MAEVMTNEQIDLSYEDVRRIKSFIDSGLAVVQQVEDLNAGLKDTAKTIAEEINIKPAVLMKALRVAFKASISEEKTRYEHVETILAAAGRI